MFKQGGSLFFSPLSLIFWVIFLKKDLDYEMKWFELLVLFAICF